MERPGNIKPGDKSREELQPILTAVPDVSHNIEPTISHANNIVLRPGPDSRAYEIYPNSQYEGTYPTIEVKSLHLSCKSDVSNGHGWENYSSMGGIIVYSVGSLSEKISIRMKPGYIFLKDVQGKKRAGDEGQVHGTLCRLLLGYQPSEIIDAGGCLSGFAVVDGGVRTNSWTCNASRIYGDGMNKMLDDEKRIVTNAVHMWHEGTAKGRNIPVSSLIDSKWLSPISHESKIVLPSPEKNPRAYKIYPNSKKEGRYPTIEVKTLELSGESDVSNGGGWNGHDTFYLEGIIVYSVGSLSDKISIKMKPGYIFLKTEKKVKEQKRWNDEGEHGTLCRLLLEYQPSQITAAGGCLSGFAVIDGVARRGSWTSYASNIYGDGMKRMLDVEKKLVDNAVHMWRKGRAEGRGQNIPASSAFNYTRYQ